ncbi:MAG: beta-CASP ribonuclease aCPSF1 [Nitrososphaeria archaeon]
MNQVYRGNQMLVARILGELKPEAKVSRIEYEGPRIAIYTDNPRYFVDNGNVIGQLVVELRKRIIVKASESARKPPEEVRDYIMSIAPREAGINRIFFDSVLGEVLVEAADAKLLQIPELSEQEFFARTGWRPRIRQSSPIQSPAVEQMYYALADAEERMSFLRRTGERIFRDHVYPRSEVVLTVLGAAREVGRSCLLAATPESRVLMDCGVHPGARGPLNSYPRLDWLDMSLDDVDAVVISHAHLDHVGFLPVLFKHGYRGPVYMTEPTLALSTLLLTDALKVAQAEGRPAPYSGDDVRAMIAHTITLPYGLVTDITPDVKLTLYNAGHILGSAIVHLHVGDGAHNIVYTGDFKFDNTRLFQAAYFNFVRAETLIMESTYGSRADVMPARVETERVFAESLKRTLEGGGKVLIPVPAVGRAQEIMLVINELIKSNAIPEVPVYLEGMLKEATGIHLLYSDYLSPFLRSEIKESGANPFLEDWYTIVDSSRRRAEIVQERGPSIIMATSGMLEGGPSIYYFSELAEDPANKMLFVSYQVPGTTGRHVLDSPSREVNLFDSGTGRMRVIRVNAAVERVEGFSGHSDFNQLTRYVSRLQRKVRKVLVIHGEHRKAEEFALNVQQHLKVNAYAPQLLDSIRLY